MEDQETRSISKESIGYQDWYHRVNPNTDDGEEMAEIYVPQHDYHEHPTYEQHAFRLQDQVESRD